MIDIQLMASKRDQQFNIRVSEEVKTELQEIAESEHRTVSGLLTAIVLD